MPSGICRIFRYETIKLPNSLHIDLRLYRRRRAVPAPEVFMTTAISIEKPTAEANIEPIGRRNKVPRDHLLELVIRLAEGDARFTDKSYVADVVRKSLEDFPGAQTRGLGDVSVWSKNRKAGSVVKVVVGFDGSVICAGKPEDASIARLRGGLLGAGYRLVVHERRECAEAE